MLIMRKKEEKLFEIPKEARAICALLKMSGYEAYLVGGCVRDMIVGVEPKDWDITTSARPEQIQGLFPESVYENSFGTVAVKTESEDPRLKIVEVTTFRIEGKYSDKRHPDEVRFADKVENDLSRRDFTINAMAYDIDTNEVIDPYGGREDLDAGVIRTVGDPLKRFEEDALRLMRGVRFAAEFGFVIEEYTEHALRHSSGLLEMIAKERIRDEFIKIIMTEKAMEGVEALERAGLLKFVMPELRDGIGIGQNEHHIYSVWEHNLKSLEYAVKKDYSLEVRLAALLHDVGKPKTKAGDGLKSTFYNHELVGARIVARMLDRLHVSKHVAEYVIHLVRYHMFYYNVGEVSPAGVRRFLARVGPESIDDLIKVREADRIGSGVPKAVPYKLRHLLFMIEKVKRDPISPKMLKIDGLEIMETLGIKPGPRIGKILSILLEEVIEDPFKNENVLLKRRVQELDAMVETALDAMVAKAKETKDEFEEGVEKEMKKQFHV
ncbi:MAG: Polynucleotide adenylyltransferase/metal dependent phosphohydrolase [Candidatus Wolfebacteria bacterium GW2011_GWC2_46_275]|nr:MAG: Polynucleotide adenylyltransferase/metal dependent phosphohydrolase [Candidatus Wolfebacteria bacterium GW2011_GWC2_46_275]KKU41167.1 MAG: Polynucleotide adenylyltransferase/metal dependent phosphohydrolase [Candidatus Wolfebacteria bacterium GW2011_GWB2_46_69]KKU53408.1 MAG: Polynucleotide adenylyltransferase/metal dependent phosphohydrolase [Candidatus Wolfebacteria bacterium GW2011_GWC1_47_103]KKU58796.1 MAG: Polynucleotide adenylyltransferase/metal dependent phosphohydrolase [Candida